jgi:hypothetical protein
MAITRFAVSIDVKKYAPPYSLAVAASIEADAKEVVACAHLYQTMASSQDSLAAGLEVLMDRLNEAYRIFLRTRAEEAARGQPG